MRNWNEVVIKDRLKLMDDFMSTLDGEEWAWVAELLDLYAERLRKAGVRIGYLGVRELVIALIEFELRSKNGRTGKRWY